jgi:ribonuclease HI
MITHMPTNPHNQPDLFAQQTLQPSIAFSESSPDWIVSFDGAMEPAGDPKAQGSWGFVVHDSTGKEIHRESLLMPLGACQSNNVAEYTALIQAIGWAEVNLPRDAAVLFQGDSQVVIHNVRGVWGWSRKKTRRHPHKDAPHLRLLLSDVTHRLSKFRPLAKPFKSEPGSSPLANELPIIWVPGETNPADSVSREPYDKAGITYRKR